MRRAGSVATKLISYIPGKREQQPHTRNEDNRKIEKKRKCRFTARHRRSAICSCANCSESRVRTMSIRFGLAAERSLEQTQSANTLVQLRTACTREESRNWTNKVTRTSERQGLALSPSNDAPLQGSTSVMKEGCRRMLASTPKL